MWRGQKPKDFLALKLEVLINGQHNTQAFKLFHAYLDGRNFKIENLLKHDELACRKFNIWKSNQGKLQNSFSKSSMSNTSASMMKLRKISSSSRIFNTSKDCISEGNLPNFGSQAGDTSPNHVRMSNVSFDSNVSRQKRQFFSSRRAGEIEIIENDSISDSGSSSNSENDLFENVENLTIEPK